MTPLIEGFHSGYERKGIYSVEQIFAQLGNRYAIWDGDLIAIRSLRYEVFHESLQCVRCGLVGSYFAKERSARFHKESRTFTATTPAWHFNLYAMTVDGREILMTKDHIVPRSKGGKDVKENLQTMCAPCNCKKGDRSYYQSVFLFEGSIIITV